ncbi:hypothetical protein I6H48_02280 [Corynebacterium amycolatum]|uniref:ABC transporter permease n=1 Tax=Corynebacterium amycolatum TaxID=43765 RepID=A0A7T4KQG3_CORAY|nr:MULTISPECIES: hypothetical protein [Corynebacterium]QQB83092.1 hypothetical protein I6H48_02280 [Corynebacterium amycolatum]
MSVLVWLVQVRFAAPVLSAAQLLSAALVLLAALVLHVVLRQPRFQSWVDSRR